MPARKFTERKPARLSQNMSTSKKLPAPNRSRSNTIKRAINFNNIGLHKLKTDTKSKLLKNVLQENDIVSNSQNIDEVNSNNESKPPPTSKSVLKNPPEIQKIGFYTKTPKSMSIDKQNSMKNSKSFLKKGDKLNYSMDSLSSDKENDEDVHNSLNEQISTLLTSHCNEINNLEKMHDVPNELKSIIQNNMKISESIIKLSSKLVENNVKLLNAFSEIFNTENSASGTNATDIGGPSISRDRLKSLTLPEVEFEDDIPHRADSKETDLRRIALFNSNLSENIKKSASIYTSLKSSMGFLKTPQPNGTIDISNPDSPNTKSRAFTSKNVKMQLERLFD